MTKDEAIELAQKENLKAEFKDEVLNLTGQTPKLTEVIEAIRPHYKVRLNGVHNFGKGEPKLEPEEEE